MSWIAAAVVGSAVVGGVVASNAAGNAADAQVQGSANASAAQVEAARIAADAQIKASDNASATALTTSREANAILQAQYNTNRNDQAPWRQAGQNALNQQVTGTQPGGEFNTTYGEKFDPSKITMDPGYDFRINAGKQAIEGSAAARGGLLSGGTLKALTDYGQQAASQEYGAAYGRYNAAYSDAYNRYNADTDRRFNRLSALAGIGQTATNATAQSGTATASSMSGNLTNAGNQISANATNTGNALAGQATATGNALASQYIGAGNAAAAGAVGQANAINGAIGGATNGYMSLQYLNKLGAGGGAGSPVMQNGAAFQNAGTNYNALGYTP